MGRIIGKTERMPTISADIFGETAAFGQKVDEVPGNDANRRVADFPRHLTLLEERMPAMARILLEPVARRHVPDAVAEDAAQVAHLLLEGR
jgi:hypothetical protein